MYTKQIFVLVRMQLRNHVNTRHIYDIKSGLLLCVRMRFHYTSGLLALRTVEQWFSTWGVAKFWWGVEVEDIMNQLWWEYKMKMHLLRRKLTGRYKAGSLVYCYRTTIQACYLCILLFTGKIYLQECCS